MTTRPNKPPLATGLDGSWLLVVVASEALAILGSHVGSAFARPEIVVFLGLCWFLLGGFFYFVIISLILYRWLFEPMGPLELTPPYWINMGAAAIATLAGTRLEAVAGASPLLTHLLPAIRIATVAFWSIATWWIPLLTALLFWRHVIKRIPLFYRLEYWSIVFPIGMYTAATWALMHETTIGFLYVIPPVCLWVAIAAWLAAFIGMSRRCLS